MKYFIIFGPPGAGKGTQATGIVERYNVKHISTGELLRSEIAAGTELGKKAQSLISAGCLVPDEVVEGMIETQFDTVKGVEGFLLDGFPRTLAQAEVLDAMLARRGEEVTAVIGLQISDDIVRQRIAHRANIEGRADDAKEEVINNRIKTYHTQTEPIIDYYRKAGKYHEVNGFGAVGPEGIGIVRERIVAVMDKL
ncbi:MAG: adenylate kinase [Bacteroidales bacterium]|nr:adenylate kinase [Bacteroidales bacterium]